MKDRDKQLLDAYNCGTIAAETCMEQLSVDVRTDIDFVRKEMHAAISHENIEEIEMALTLIRLYVWAFRDASGFVDILNELLVNANHESHQEIARALQNTPHASTVPFVRIALESNFDYIPYTGYDERGIAKWFSWLLYAIGTEEAVQLMKDYAGPDKNEIGDEMRYRLIKMRNE